MSFKIGQVNLIDYGEGLAGFNVMYNMDVAFKADAPKEFGISVYAGKKKLSALKWDKKPAIQYSGDDSTLQGHTSYKKISSGSGKGLGANQRAINMYYASGIPGGRGEQAAMGANSGGVHTIIAWAIDESVSNGKLVNAARIVDARIVTVKKTSGLKNDDGSALPSNIGVNGYAVTSTADHSEIKDAGPVPKITISHSKFEGLLMTAHTGSHRDVTAWGVGEDAGDSKRKITFESHTLLESLAFNIAPNSGANTAKEVYVYNKDGTTLLGSKTGIKPVNGESMPAKYIIKLAGAVTDQVIVKLIPESTSAGYASIWSAEFNKAGADASTVRPFYLYNGKPYPNTSASNRIAPNRELLEKKIDALVELNLQLIELLKSKLL